VLTSPLAPVVRQEEGGLPGAGPARGAGAR